MPELSNEETAWYCFQALPKKEHLAANFLRKEMGLAVCCPRVASLKITKRGKVRFLEPLFPGYVFVRADLKQNYRRILSTNGIRKLVVYGEKVPVVPESFMDDLQKHVQGDGILEAKTPQLEKGQTVRILDGPFENWEAVVSGLITSKERVLLFLEFLGRQMEIAVDLQSVLSEKTSARESVWKSGDH